MADLGDLFSGTPPTYGVQMMGGGRSPLFDFAKYFGNYMKGLVGQPLPSYQGQIDPGMSPTMASLGQMLQAFSQSPMPSVMGQAGGVLGRFMNPSFANPMARTQMMGGNAPQFFGGSGMRNPFGPGGNQSPPWLPPGVGGGGTPPWMQPPGGGPPMGGQGPSPDMLRFLTGGGPGQPPMGGSPLGGDPGMGGPVGPPPPFNPGVSIGGPPPAGGAAVGPPLMAPPAMPGPPPPMPTIDASGMGGVGLSVPGGGGMSAMPSSPSLPMGGGMSNITSPAMTNTTGGGPPQMPPVDGSGMRSMFGTGGGFVPGVSRMGGMRNITPAPPPPPGRLRNKYMPKKGKPRILR